MRLGRVLLVGTAVSFALFAQDVPNLAEARSILREASALIPEIEEGQRGSAACNISGQQAKAGDLEGATATIQQVPEDSRETALFCSASTIAARGDWRIAVKNIEELTGNKTGSLAYLFVATQLAQQHDFQDAVTVARRLRDGSNVPRFIDAMVQIYAKQFKAGDAGASQTLNEALDAVENIERQQTPIFDIATRYASLVQMAAIGGEQAAYPVMERLYQLSVAEKDPAKKQGILAHLAQAQAAAGDFPGARRSADELAEPAKDKALITIANSLARQGDPDGARVLANQIPAKSWSDLDLREFGLALAGTGDYDGAVAMIDRQSPESRGEAFGILALESSGKSKVWALTAAELALDAARTRKDSGSFPFQLVAVARGNLGDIAGATQIVNQLEGKDRQWPMWSLTGQMVEAGHKSEALALARSQDPYPRTYGLLGTAAEIIELVEQANKKAAGGR